MRAGCCCFFLCKQKTASEMRSSDWPSDVCSSDLLAGHVCGEDVTCQAMPLDDSWLRDTGPTFVVDGRGGVAGVDWRFNSWGERFLPYDKDAMVAERLLGQLDVERYAEIGRAHV